MIRGSAGDASVSPAVEQLTGHLATHLATSLAELLKN